MEDKEPITLEKLVRWFHRAHEIAPWCWNMDPKLEGITKEQFDFLRNTDAEPTEVPQLFKI